MTYRNSLRLEITIATEINRFLSKGSQHTIFTEKGTYEPAIDIHFLLCKFKIA